MPIEVENAVKTYQIGEVETRALDGVTWASKKANLPALVGPSGSGKDHPAAVDGLPGQAQQRRGEDQRAGCRPSSSNNQRADLRREKIGFIFQFFALVPVLSAYENVELPLLLERRQAQGAQRARDGTAGSGRPGRPGRSTAPTR